MARPYYRYPYKYPYKKYYETITEPEESTIDGETILWSKSLIPEIKSAYEESEAEDLSTWVNSMLKFAIDQAYPEIAEKSDMMAIRNELLKQAGNPEQILGQISGEHRRAFEEQMRKVNLLEENETLDDLDAGEVTLLALRSKEQERG